MTRPFEKEYLWHIERQMDSDGNRQEISFYDHLPDMGSPDYDHKAFTDSQMGDALISLLEPFLIFDDEDGKAVKKYWERYGLRKNVHEKESGAPEWNKYCVFTPIEAQEDINRKFPCVIYVHGSRLGGTKIFCEESSGVATMAAKYRLICALPDNNTTDGVMRVYEKLLKEYPVDPSRVYLCGFSAGAVCSVETGLKHPELFAGILSITGSPASKEFDAQAAERAKKMGLPFIGIGGTCEMTTKFPLSDFGIKTPEEVERHKKHVHMTPEGKIQGLNTFLAANGLETISLEETKKFVAQSDRKEIQAIGVKAPYFHTENILGMNHYFAEYRNSDGVPVVKIVALDGHPHHPAASAYDIAWNFWQRFSRDPDTKKLMIAK